MLKHNTSYIEHIASVFSNDTYYNHVNKNTTIVIFSNIVMWLITIILETNIKFIKFPGY
jgi:hypothetical protein